MPKPTRAQLRALQAISEGVVIGIVHPTGTYHFVTLAPRGQRCRSDVIQRLIDGRLASIQLGGCLNSEEGCVVLTWSGERTLAAEVPA